MQLPAVVLAAGRSVRFDGDKLATQLASGQSLAGRLMALLDAHTNIDPLIVVIAPDRDLSILAPDARRAVAVTNPDPSRGHSSSLHLGLREVARAKPDALGTLLASARGGMKHAEKAARAVV